ncbi:hypothetical protein OCAR_6605 [Afipia carboxidovorans OM5]|nr:hypothetical protein OCAR_6605 [Afipia carboxidovorans OM5]
MIRGSDVFDARQRSRFTRPDAYRQAIEQSSVVLRKRLTARGT